MDIFYYGNYFTCTLLFHDGLSHCFSDSFIMTLLTSFICRNYDKLKTWFNQYFFHITEMEITLPVHCCSMMVSVTILVIVSSWHSWRVLSTEIMIKLKCDLMDFFHFGNVNYSTCTLLLYDGLSHHFSDSFIMTLLTSFICRNYDRIEMLI